MGNIGVVLVIILVVVYFIPSYIASNKKKRNAGAIFALNLFAGWTIAGWIVALVWALCIDKK